MPGRYEENPGGRVCGLLKIIQKKYINIIRGKFDTKPLMSL